MKLQEGFRNRNIMKLIGPMAVVVFVMLVWPAMSMGVQEPPRSQERVSKPGEIQTGRKKIAQHGTAMNPQRRPRPTPVAGKVLLMENALKQKPEAAVAGKPQGKRQAAVNIAQAENPEKGAGEQKPRPGAETRPQGSHLQLVLRISDSGKAEVVSAKELPGPAVTSQTGPGQWVTAVFSGNKVIAAQGIPDPFEMRSFAPPPGSPLEGQGHHIEHAKTALVPVAVPNLTLKSPEMATLSLHLYRVKEGPPLLQVDPNIFRKLQQENRLEMRVTMPPATLQRQIQLRTPATDR